MAEHPESARVRAGASCASGRAKSTKGLPPPLGRRRRQATGALPDRARLLDAWSKGSGDQSVGDQLLAEHALLERVLAAMESESGRMKAGAPLDGGFWKDVIDFLGNFVHRCHRVKEQEHFFPALVEAGLVEQNVARTLEHEHGVAGALTEHLCTRADAGDWEGVMRLASVYAHLIRPHVRREEERLVRPARARLDPAAEQRLCAAAAAVERTALGSDGRRRYLEMARAICVRASVQAP